jgi:hemerythrin-like domain-containing protein
MEAAQILMDEHRVIERVLDALEAAAARLDAGEEIPPDFFLMAADFIKRFADGSHHNKEEGVLFPAMEAAGIPNEGGPIGVMLAEHQEARRLTAAMRTAANELAAGEADAKRHVVGNALKYVTLLRAHIAKEDGVLYPMADQAIQGAAREEFSQAFKQVAQEETSQRVFEEFTALAESIGRESAR